jgi:hypothetical protein
MRIDAVFVACLGLAGAAHASPVAPISSITLSARPSVEAYACETAKPQGAAKDVLADRANCS